MSDNKWIVDKNKNLAISCIPKNASGSFRSAVKGKYVSNKDVLSVNSRIVWLRNTYQRLQSGFSFYKAHHDKGNKTDINPIHTQNWTTWIDNILDNKSNSHWDSQVDQLTYKGKYLGTTTHRMEDLKETWGLYYSGFLPELNGCVHEIVDKDYRLDEINLLYKTDINLWNSLGN